MSPDKIITPSQQYSVKRPDWQVRGCSPCFSWPHSQAFRLFYRSSSQDSLLSLLQAADRVSGHLSQSSHYLLPMHSLALFASCALSAVFLEMPSSSLWCFWPHIWIILRTSYKKRFPGLPPPKILGGWLHYTQSWLMNLYTRKWVA